MSVLSACGGVEVPKTLSLSNLFKCKLNKAHGGGGRKVYMFCGLHADVFIYLNGIGGVCLGKAGRKGKVVETVGW